ncbi:dockerin type I domain-containing protein [Botrimarina hoheduenensis]|uniref:Dockerin domain-containing protein n=1 Tax=Botrimarina hoheduenensis TaxID=2528000 RepID=A0A5C5VQI1_9BACT|nr:dockerin type I domain-containing protein [Botrimarina hoheduenensis]TWT40061.1 hypothetical protein Pla111_34660 [Botrimarina hoheduenensis]
MMSSRSRVTISLVSMGGLLLTGALRATPLAVVNPGFEATAGSVSIFNEFSFGGFLGWEVYDNPLGLVGNGASNPYYVGTLQPQPDPLSPGNFVFFPNGAPEGNRVAIAYNRAGSGGLGEYGLQQTLLGTPLQPFRTYRLRVEVGNIASGRALSGEDFDLSGFPGYRIDLLAGGVPLASDNSQLAGSLGEGEFATSLVTFATNASDLRLGLDLGVRLVNLNQIDPLAPTADLEVDFDNVRIDVVPTQVGDFNFDGTVDAADYTVWRDSLGSQQDLSADGNQDGVINEADYDLWGAHYGATLGGLASALSPAGHAHHAGLAVPEPAADGLMLGAVVLAHGVRPRR